MIRLESAQRREGLDTNGIGGFASSTINGRNTRTYHGLLSQRPGLRWGQIRSALQSLYRTSCPLSGHFQPPFSPD